MDQLLKSLQDVDPLWSVALVVVAIVVLLVSRLWRASFGRALALIVPILVLIGAAGAGYYWYLHLDDLRRLEERRALDQRAAALFSQAIQPGSVFACLDGSPVPAMMEACERNLFAEPARVAAAVAIVSQRLAFLTDALQFASTRDPSYLGRIESLRNSIEADHYGFVAYVLSIDHRCTVEECERFKLLRDSSRVRENIRVRRFEAFMAKHAPSWRATSAPPSEAEALLPPGGNRVSVPAVSIGGRAGAQEIPDPSSARTSPPPQAESVVPTVTPGVTVPAAEITSTEPPPEPSARPPEATSEKSTQPAAKSPQPATTKSAQPPAAAKAAAPKATATAGGSKGKADPVTRRSSEPVPGLPRVVPKDYAKEQDEGPPQTVAQPGAPIPIGPAQQNFTGN
jgi:hypothetical protein